MLKYGRIGVLILFAACAVEPPIVPDAAPPDETQLGTYTLEWRCLDFCGDPTPPFVAFDRVDITVDRLMYHDTACGVGCDDTYLGELSSNPFTLGCFVGLIGFELGVGFDAPETDIYFLCPVNGGFDGDVRWIGKGGEHVWQVTGARQ